MKNKTHSDLEEEVKAGRYIKKNLRNSTNITLECNDINYNCTVIIDEYKDLKGEENYIVEHYSDLSKNYNVTIARPVYQHVSIPALEEDS